MPLFEGKNDYSSKQQQMTIVIRYYYSAVHSSKWIFGNGYWSLALFTTFNMQIQKRYLLGNLHHITLSCFFLSLSLSLFQIQSFLFSLSFFLNFNFNC